MTLDEQRLVFDRFYRTDAARAHAQKGTGLGLSICKWITEAHHGTIEVTSTFGQGSCFTISLPILPTDLSSLTIPVFSFTLTPALSRLWGERKNYKLQRLLDPRSGRGLYMFTHSLRQAQDRR